MTRADGSACTASITVHAQRRSLPVSRCGSPTPQRLWVPSQGNSPPAWIPRKPRIPLFPPSPIPASIPNFCICPPALALGHSAFVSQKPLSKTDQSRQVASQLRASCSDAPPEPLLRPVSSVQAGLRHHFSCVPWHCQSLARQPGWCVCPIATRLPILLSLGHCR
jgi:hypothetical protein